MSYPNRLRQMGCRIIPLALLAGIVISGFAPEFAQASEMSARPVLLRDVVTLEGVRENPLIGYGIVVGLNGTGDRRQTIFTIQTLANVMQHMGVQISPATVRVNNVAAVFVTAALPPFAHPGTHVDVTISSIGDAKSLEGGMLLLTPLYGADGQIYAAAQGALTLGGYSSGGAGNSKTVNHPTVGRVPAGGVVEQAIQSTLGTQDTLSLLLTDPSYRGAEDIAAAINREFGHNVSQAMDGRLVEVHVHDAGALTPNALMARIENLEVTLHPRAKVVVNERTGTVVLGREVRLGAVSILHGSLTIEITTNFSVSQPPPLSNGQTAVVAQPSVQTQDRAARRIELKEGASVEDLVNGLQLTGATARDVIAILQAIKAAGALQADLEVL